MKALKGIIGSLVRDDSGQDLIEYALLAALIALACVVAMGLVAGGINGLFTRVNTQLGTAGGGA